MQSRATTVEQYLADLPDGRRAALVAVREVIRKNLDLDYEEGMQYGMIGYCVPYRVFPAGYHCDPKRPLPFAGLASQKNHMALYLMSCYGNAAEEQWLRAQWAKTGKKLDMGKSCIRFRKLEDLALDVIGEAIRRAPARKYVAHYAATMQQLNEGASRATAKKKVARKPSRPAVRSAKASGAVRPAVAARRTT